MAYEMHVLRSAMADVAALTAASGLGFGALNANGTAIWAEKELVGAGTTLFESASKPY
ncbi:MAG TPA: hypothetical protein VHV55_15895 [Pirellulales bacterium]|jgi:hypothetical protein|nr:hypothetical protein [Pirellulales bacterium]